MRDRDLYVFCECQRRHGRCDGQSQPQATLGMDVRAAQNSNGKAFGAEIYAAISKPEGQIAEVDYMSPEPSPDDALAAKATLVARADDDLGCGVGYYQSTVPATAAANLRAGQPALSARPARPAEILQGPPST